PRTRRSNHPARRVVQDGDPIRRAAVKSIVVMVGVLLACTLARPVRAQAAGSPVYGLRGGWWFDGSGFVRKSLFVADGVFREGRTVRVDSIIDLGDQYIVPPFGDAHTHAFDNPASIGATVESNLRDGIFYAFSLTNSIAGKK